MKRSISPAKHRYMPLFILLMVASFVTTSCDETDQVASALLYDDGPTSSVNVTMNRSSAFTLSDGTKIYGLDVFVRNEMTDPITNVTIRFDDAQPLSRVLEFSRDSATIETISPGNNVRPTFYWCFDCNGANERRIGNFYVITFDNVSGGLLIEATFTVSYTLKGSRFSDMYTLPFTTVTNPQSP